MGSTDAAFTVALMGLPGSGKTTVAKLLQARLKGTSIISRDQIRDAMFQPCAYTDLEKKAAYDALLIALGTCLELHRSCILDGMTFSRSQEVDAVRRICESHAARVFFVLLELPIIVAQQRIRADIKKGIDAPLDRDEGLVKIVADRFQPPPSDVIILDAQRSPEDLRDSVLALLQSS
jgi:predicted kinase